MRPLKALISKNTMHRAHASFFIKDNCPVELKNVKDGNIIEIFSHGLYTIFIIVDHKNLPPFIQHKIPESCETVFIRFCAGSGYSFWELNSFKEKFPYSKKWDDIEITRIWAANINIKNLKSENDFKVLYDEICSKIK